MKLRSLCTLVVCGSLAGCGGGSSAPGDTTGDASNGAGGSSSGTGGESTTGAGGSATTGAGGGSTGTGGGAVTGTCAMPATYAGPALTTGMWVDVTGSLKSVNRIWAVPKTDKILAGVNGSGLFAYTAAGKAWTQLAAVKGSTVSQIVFDPCNGNRFWLAAQGAGGGVYYTEDGGATAKKLGTMSDVTGVSVDFKVTMGQTIIAAKTMPSPWVDGGGAVSVSTDGGTTWNDQTAAFAATKATPFGYVYAIDNKTMLASAFLNGTAKDYNAQGGIWVTKDGGTTWAQGMWVDGPYCAGYGWCNYSTWNQPWSEAVVDTKTNSIWWINFWQNTIFTSSDNGSTWVDNWGYWDHAAVGGGVPTAIPAKDLPKDPTVSDPGMVTIKKRCNSHATPCGDADKQTGILYHQHDKNGKGMDWWADLIMSPVPYDSASNTDQLAFDSVANALFMSAPKSTGKLVWMYAFPN